MKKLAVAFMSLSLFLAFSTAAFAECNKDVKSCSKEGKSCCKESKSCGSKAAASKDPTAQEVVIDPTCGMDVTVKDAKYSYKYNGKTYYFCSRKCKNSFAKDPSKFIGKESK